MNRRSLGNKGAKEEEKIAVAEGKVSANETDGYTASCESRCTRAKVPRGPRRTLIRLTGSFLVHLTPATFSTLIAAPFVTGAATTECLCSRGEACYPCALFREKVLGIVTVRSALLNDGNATASSRWKKSTVVFVRANF